MVLASPKPDELSGIELRLLPLGHSLVNFPENAALPAWTQQYEADCLVSFTRSIYGFSVICPDRWVPESILRERVSDWRVFRVEQPRDWALHGFYARLTQPLADDAISIYIVGSYNSDHVLVRGKDLDRALQILTRFCKIT
jgi:hypothetical protein